MRENQTGNMGSFETDLEVPDLKKTPLRMSSVVLASQRTPNTAKPNPKIVSPLTRDGLQWVPNVSHVFRQDQHLYFLYEVYDPSHGKGDTQAKGTAAPLHLLTSIEFLSGGTKVYETPLVTATTENVPGRNAVAFQFDVPASQLKPGTYVCQVNVIDDAGGTFSFPRMAVKVTAPPAAATTDAQSASTNDKSASTETKPAAVPQ